MKFKFKNKNRHRVIRKENTNFIDFVLVATTDSPRLLFLNFISYKHIILLSITIWHFLTCTEYHDVFESALLLGLSNLCSNQGARNGTCFAYLTREKHWVKIRGWGAARDGKKFDFARLSKIWNEINWMLFINSKMKLLLYYQYILLYYINSWPILKLQKSPVSEPIQVRFTSRSFRFSLKISFTFDLFSDRDFDFSDSNTSCA